MLTVLTIVILGLALGQRANDVAKGVATLVGSGAAPYPARHLPGVPYGPRCAYFWQDRFDRETLPCMPRCNCLKPRIFPPFAASGRYPAGKPRLSMARANPILVGSDNMGIEVHPHANKDLLFPVHQIMVTAHGIFLLENLDLEALARDKTSEFAFVVLPLKIKGGTGSTVAPIAIR